MVAGRCTCTTYGWCAVCRPVVTDFTPPLTVPDPPRSALVLDYHLRISAAARETAALVVAAETGKNLSQAADIVDRVLATFLVYEEVEE